MIKRLLYKKIALYTTMKLALTYVRDDDEKNPILSSDIAGIRKIFFPSKF